MPREAAKVAKPSAAITRSRASSRVALAATTTSSLKQSLKNRKPDVSYPPIRLQEVSHTQWGWSGQKGLDRKQGTGKMPSTP